MFYEIGVQSMFVFPESGEFNKRIPKQKFYENIDWSSTVKKFVEQISAVYWRNKLAATTLNVEMREYVSEIKIFEIQVNNLRLMK